jgi:pectinesterase
VKFYLFFAALLGVSISNGQPKVITVAKDGSGNFTSVQQAFNSIPLHNKKRITVYVKKGVYKEKLHLDSTKEFVTLKGEDRFSTILTFNDHTGVISPKGDTINTYSSYSFLESANNFRAENICFNNDAGFTAGQAVALDITGDKVAIENCRITGNQDVLFMSYPSTRQVFLHCYIEGTTDFIFGPSTAWFEQCHIHSKKNSHVTAASTPAEQAYGFVFHDCVLTGDTILNKVSLGRPWRPYAKVVYFECYIDRHIYPAGWSNWNNTENYKTTYYAEYHNYGPGADTKNRISWSHQLSDEQIKQYTIQNVIGSWYHSN